MTQCIGCPHCNIDTDEEFMSFAKCTKTSKKGRMIDWAMTTINLDTNVRTNGEDRVKESLRKRITPSWCPVKVK